MARRNITRQGIIDVRRVIEPRLVKRFNEIKEDMLDSFNFHPVTKEIEMGASAENISGTIKGEGNLFSFIGFSSGDNPVEIIRKRLENTNITIKFRSAEVFEIFVNSPDRQEIFRISPLPWASGRSWVKGIEQGMSGLGRFLYGNYPSSRSGAGVQVKSNIKKVTFKNVSYISSILRKFENDVRRLERGAGL